MNPATVQKLYEGFVTDNVESRRGAVSEAFALYAPLIFKRIRYKFIKVLSESDTEDVVQEAFLKLYLTKSKPMSVESFRSWILKIVMSEALAILRSDYFINIERPIERPQDESEDAEGLSLEETYEMPPVVISPDGVITAINEQLNRSVEACVTEGMMNFSKDYPDREIILSMLLDGSPIQEIADLYNRTEHAMRQFIYESKKKLMPFIEHCLADLREA